MIHLVEKEFKINPPIISFRKDKLISSFLTLFLVGVMIFVSTFMFVLLYQKFDTYNASLSFATMYLYGLSILALLYAILQARKTYFNDLDYQITVSRPIDVFVMIFSKALYLFLNLLIFELILFSPHYIAFGQMSDRFVSYYYMVLLSIIFHTIFDLAVALILVAFVEVLYRYLKRNVYIQVGLIIIVMLGATYLYSSVLNIFLNLLNDSSMSYLFNDTNIAFLNNLSNYLYPDVFISRSLLTLNYGGILSYILISIGGFILSLIVLYLLYPRVVSLVLQKDRLQKEKKRKIGGPRRAIFKKELLLLTRESDNLYNFTGLVLVAPLLTFLVLRGINQSFRTGIFSVYSSILPNFMESVTILIVLLFSSIIALSGSNLMKSEHKTVRIIKYLPYPITNQIYIKMVILGIATLFTNIVSLLLLLIFKEINITLFLFLLVADILLNVSLIIISFRSEIKNFSKINNENALASFLALMVPSVIVAGNILISLITTIKPLMLYIANTIILIGIFLLVTIYLKRGFRRDLELLEVIN